MGLGTRTTVAVTASVVALALAAPVSADGLHVFGRIWGKGCAVTYSLDSTAAATYAPYVAAALTQIGSVTAQTFTRVADNDTSALIQYSVVPYGSLGNSEYGGVVAGTGGTDGRVRLIPMETLATAGGQYTDIARQNLVAHETMHVLGLGHDLDATDPTGPDEIMYPGSSAHKVFSTAFGAGDTTGLTAVKDTNKCGTPEAISLTPDGKALAATASPAAARWSRPSPRRPSQAHAEVTWTGNAPLGGRYVVRAYGRGVASTFTGCAAFAPATGCTITNLDSRYPTTITITPEVAGFPPGSTTTVKLKPYRRP